MANLAKVQIEFTPEAVGLISRLIDALERQPIGESHPVADPFPAAAPAAEPEKQPEAPAADPAPVQEAAPAVVYTLEQVRSRVMALSRKGAGYKDKVKKALNKYADNVPGLDPKDYAAFMADLEAIE